MSENTENGAETTVSEAMNSLNGFDELAIEKAFGSTWESMAEKRPSTLTRALIFVQFRRDGQTDAEAKKAALSMTLGQVQGYFAQDDELMPDDPTTAAGKDS